jgi:hypothetical protein
VSQAARAGCEVDEIDTFAGIVEDVARLLASYF